MISVRRKSLAHVSPRSKTSTRVLPNQQESRKSKKKTDKQTNKKKTSEHILSYRSDSEENGGMRRGGFLHALYSIKTHRPRQQQQSRTPKTRSDPPLDRDTRACVWMCAFFRTHVCLGGRVSRDGGCVFELPDRDCLPYRRQHQRRAQHGGGRSACVRASVFTGVLSCVSAGVCPAHHVSVNLKKSSIL